MGKDWKKNHDLGRWWCIYINYFLIEASETSQRSLKLTFLLRDSVSFCSLCVGAFFCSRRDTHHLRRLTPIIQGEDWNLSCMKCQLLLLFEEQGVMLLEKKKTKKIIAVSVVRCIGLYISTYSCVFEECRPMWKLWSLHDPLFFPFL